ncbi:MAG: ABC transporter permease, partial [Pseudomonadota bacterium]|nr:ABC transporter permease [Pseudomonadota bacterium]
MKTIRTVFFKEIVDNFRDRRTLISALLMGPLFGPILFAFVINLTVSQSLENAEEALELPVIGAE